MAGLRNWVWCAGAVLMAGSAAMAQVEPGQAAANAKAPATWTQAGWGGGGFYYAAAFHPTRDGVIYLAGDVAGVYKSEDHGKTFRMINNGLVNYGVFSLAVDRSSPETVYAATEGGICKSTDGGEHWQLLPKPGPMARQLSGIKGRSVRCVAVDPSNSNIVYVASPFGKVYKSTDGGANWDTVYAPQTSAPFTESLEAQFGKSNADYHGGFWMPLEFPAQAKAAECTGFGLRFQGGGTAPRDTIVTLRTKSGASYRSRNVNEIFKGTQMQDVLLQAKDFTLDPEYVKKNPDSGAPATPDWANVNRMDFVCVGSLPEQAYTGRFARIYFAMADAAKPAVVRDFASDKTVQAYGNIRIAGNSAKQESGEPIYSITVSAKDPSMVLAATASNGLLMSNDRGRSWRALKTPKKASGAAVAESDPSVIYAAFSADGVWKSTDKGETWNKLSQGLPEKFGAVEVVVSPTNTQDVYVIGRSGWGGQFFASHDGGATWKESSRMTPDRAPGGDPTLPADDAAGEFSAPTNLTISPQNPSELFISGNWRCAWSGDAGATWSERERGADISCIYDIRFSGDRTYAAAMDEGTFVSENNGASWRQLWPLKWNKEISGHNWRLAVNTINGVDRIIATCSPWDSNANLVIRSDDGGKSYQAVKAGLPDYYPKANTMWEKGYARALAADPKNPDIVYLGIDGDPENGKMGGGIFKSTDGGKSFQQMPNQPGSRRMFFGLVVDPTDSNRLYWGSSGKNGGLYRSEDAGQSWQLVHKGTEWAFNVHVTADGTVYTPGKELFRSTDHGKTFKPITNFVGSHDIVALETHPRDPKTIWIGLSTWDGSSNGAVYKTSDGGATWQEITGNLPYRKPLILRFNPKTNELWAGGVGLYRLPQ